MGATWLGLLTGCVHETRQRAADTPPPPDYVEGGGVLRDDYFYYPGYQVYYSSNRREYVYLDDNIWVTRPAPRWVSLDVLLASPSVRLDFQDAPELHHSRVMQQYPKNWQPPGDNRGRGQANHEIGSGNDRGGHR